MQQPTVLTIAPEGSSRDSFADELRDAGWRVATASDGVAGERTAISAAPEIIVLSEWLPDVDSLDVCRRIRSRFVSDPAPVFLLTPNDLSAGVGMIMCWNKSLQEASELVVCGDLTIDGGRHYAVVAGRELNMTPTEFRLLETLARQPGRVFSRQELGEACRGDQTSVQARTIDVHVKSIRQKLEEHAELIQTVHGVGYRMKEPILIPVL